MYITRDKNYQNDLKFFIKKRKKEEELTKSQFLFQTEVVLLTYCSKMLEYIEMPWLNLVKILVKYDDSNSKF